MFREVLEAYELVKVERGLAPKRPLQKSADTATDTFRSRRPYSGEYEEDFEREKQSYGTQFDSAEFHYRAQTHGDDKKFAQHADSFREMYEANANTFKPLEGEMPNTVLRFHLDELKPQKTIFANNSRTVGAVLLLFFIGLGTLYTISSHGQVEEKHGQLEKATESVNTAKTTLEKKDIASDMLVVSADEARAFRRGRTVMGAAEKKLQRLTADPDILVPDAKVTHNSGRA